jgi:hypothetical protein
MYFLLLLSFFLLIPPTNNTESCEIVGTVSGDAGNVWNVNVVSLTVSKGRGGFTVGVKNTLGLLDLVSEGNRIFLNVGTYSPSHMA